MIGMKTPILQENNPRIKMKSPCTGWKAHPAQGRKIDAVFSISAVQEETYQLIKNAF
jgi:hypothetical protein